MTVTKQHDRIDPSVTIVTSNRKLVNRAEIRCNKKGECVTSEQDAAVNKQKLELLQKYNTEANRITQESIETALLLLMEEKEFSSISITEITSRAGVSRSAYYRNYSFREDILTNIFNRAAETIVNALSMELVAQNIINSYRILFEKVLEIRPLFEIIQMAGLTDKFQMAVNEKYLQAIDVDSAVEYYRVLSWIGSIFNIIFGWMQRGIRRHRSRWPIFAASS